MGRSAREFSPVNRHLLATVIYIGLLAALVGCSQQTDRSIDASNLLELKRGRGGEPASLDPAAASDNFSTQVIQDLYEGLTTESPTGEVVPGVASSWTVDAGGTQYTFRLRSNAASVNWTPLR